MRRLLNCSPNLSWSEKAKFLTQFNLFLYQGGHKQNFRNILTDRIIRNYLNIIQNHEDGNIMYRNAQAISDNRKTTNNKTSWFKDKGYSHNFQVPASKDQILAKEVKEVIEKVVGEKVLVSKKFGSTVVGNLRKGNPNPNLKADWKIR